MVERFPPLLGYSIAGVLQPKLAMWRQVLGLPLSDLASFPKFFSFSLNPRVQRRLRLLGRALQAESADGRGSKSLEPVDGGMAVTSSSLMSFKTSRTAGPAQAEPKSSGSLADAQLGPATLSPGRLAYLLSCSDEAFLTCTLGLQSIYVPLTSNVEQE